MRIFGLLRPGPDAAQLADWLHNMHEAFGRFAAAVTQRDPHSTEVLALFTLLRTTSSMYGIVQISHAVVRTVGLVYGDLRAYYECFWQNYLLQKFDTPQDEDRIRRLYADVSLNIEHITDALFAKNPRIKRAIGDAFGAQYKDQLASAVFEYIQGRRHSDIKESGNLFTDNIAALSQIVARSAGLARDQRSDLAEFLTLESERALEMTLLTEYDLRKSRFLEFPRDAYR